MKSIIVAAIDNSAAAGPVLEIAGAFARSVGGDLQALHVAEDGDDTAGALATAQGTSLRTVPGDVVECLVDAAEAPGVIAIVLGGRGRPGGPRPAGHIAKEVITRVRIPVVVVPPDAARPTRLERVLVPMEGLPGEAGVLAPVLELLASSGVKVAAVHVDDEASLPSYSDQVQHETEAFTREFVARYLPLTIDVELALRVGRPGPEVLDASAETTPDLVVVAWSRDLSPGRARVVRELLERSRIPVLLVPGDGDERVRQPQPDAGAGRRA